MKQHYNASNSSWLETLIAYETLEVMAVLISLHMFPKKKGLCVLTLCLQKQSR